MENISTTLALKLAKGNEMIKNKDIKAIEVKKEQKNGPSTNKMLSKAKFEAILIECNYDKKLISTLMNCTEKTFYNYLDRYKLKARYNRIKATNAFKNAKIEVERTKARSIIAHVNFNEKAILVDYEKKIGNHIDKKIHELCLMGDLKALKIYYYYKVKCKEFDLLEREQRKRFSGAY